MQHEHTDWKKEALYLAVGVVVFLIALKAYYFQEAFGVVLMLWFAQLYLFILPGYALMLYYQKQLSFVYRLFIGAGLGFAVHGILTYVPSALFNLNMLAYYKFIPLVVYALAALLLWMHD